MEKRYNVIQKLASKQMFWNIKVVVIFGLAESYLTHIAYIYICMYIDR